MQISEIMQRNTNKLYVCLHTIIFCFSKSECDKNEFLILISNFPIWTGLDVDNMVNIETLTGFKFSVQFKIFNKNS